MQTITKFSYTNQSGLDECWRAIHQRNVGGQWHNVPSAVNDMMWHWQSMIWCGVGGQWHDVASAFNDTMWHWQSMTWCGTVNDTMLPGQWHNVVQSMTQYCHAPLAVRCRVVMGAAVPFSCVLNLWRNEKMIYRAVRICRTYVFVLTRE